MYMTTGGPGGSRCRCRAIAVTSATAVTSTAVAIARPTSRKVPTTSGYDHNTPASPATWVISTQPSADTSTKTRLEPPMSPPRQACATTPSRARTMPTSATPATSSPRASRYQANGSTPIAPTAPNMVSTAKR